MANERDDENFGEKKEFERQPPAAQPAQQPPFGQQPTGEPGDGQAMMWSRIGTRIANKHRPSLGDVCVDSMAP